MKNIYVRKHNIKTSATRQKYLTSKSKQEHLLAFSELDLKEEFKDINKELVIELPNELIGKHKKKTLENYLFWEFIGEHYVNLFKEKTGYENIAYAIHLNAAGTNLHMHLSYVDRNLENTPKRAKRDSYVYVSTGKKLKKSDYNKSNPNHLKIIKGSILLNYDKVSNEKKLEWKEFMLGDNPNKAKFELRREIRETLQDDFPNFSKCQESGLGIIEQKEILNQYKELFKDMNNRFLALAGHSKKYVVGEMQELGFLPYKKVGKQVNDTPNEIQRNIINYNKTVKEFNNLVQESILESDNLTQEQQLDLIEEIEVMKASKPYPPQKAIEWNLLFLLRKVQRMYDLLKERIEVVLKKEYLIEEPAIEEPTIEEPAIEEPAIEEPAIKEPAIEEPTIEEPAIEEEYKGPALSL